MSYKHRKKKWRFEDWGKPLLKIRDWGRPASRRRLIYFFAHVGLTFSVALLVIALVAGVVLIAIYARGLIENSILNTLVVDLSRINARFGAPAAPAAPPVQYVPAPPPVTATSVPIPTTTISVNPTSLGGPGSVPQLPPNLLHSTFYFGFASSPWLDGNMTTMYEDTNESALVFPPDYSWTPDPSIPNTTYQIQNTVSGITTNVIQENGAYKVLVSASDGTPILTATSTPLVSGYPGHVGIGGTPDNFLVVYGGYKGAAAHIIRTASGWSVQDVSMYFPYRVMHGGFTPAVIGGRTSSGGSTSQVFYVYSLTPNNPKLVKLFSDASGNIIGALDFTPLLFPSGVQSATFIMSGSRTSLGSPTSQILSAKVVSTSGAVNYYRFTDNGFKTAGPYTAQSTDLNNYPWPVYGVMLTPDYGSLNGIPVQFYVSNDGATWQPAAVGEETVFGNETGSKLLWKAVFTPSGSAVSPFLGEVRLDFQVVRPKSFLVINCNEIVIDCG